MTTPEDDSGGRTYIGPLFPRLNQQVPDMRSVEMSMRRMQEAMARMAEMMNDIPRMEVQSLVASGGWVSPHPIEWDISPYRKVDPREGEEVYVYDLLPGARVYVLEDVFTVDRVDKDATLPTVWLKELPTSPLYFTPDESIYLANETEDQP